MDHMTFLGTLPPVLRRTPLFADLPRARTALKALRRSFATWRWRLRSRWELARKAEENPHLIEDVGLTQEQIEAETGKPFWRR